MTRRCAQGDGRLSIRDMVGTWRPSAAVLIVAATSALLTAACAPAPPVATVAPNPATPATVAPSSPVESIAPKVGGEAATIPAETPAEESNIDVPFAPAFDASVQPAPGTPGGGSAGLATACDDRLGFCASYPEEWIFSMWEYPETLGDIAITSQPMDSPIGMGEGMWIGIEAEAAVADQSFEAWMAQATDPTVGVKGVELGEPRPIVVGGRPAVLQVEDFMGAIDTHTFYSETAYVDDGERRWRVTAMAYTPDLFARHRHAFEIVLESLSFDPRDVEDAHANGRYFGFVREIETVETDAHVLHVDIAHMLGGDEAGRAAVEDGVIDAPDELSNDYYIRNLDTATVRFQLSITATVVLLEPNGGPELRTTRVNELLTLYGASVPAEQRWMRDAPYWITVEGGVVRRLVMQFLP